MNSEQMAIDEYLESEEGKRAVNGRLLGLPDSYDQFLRNRINLAFREGFSAGCKAEKARILHKITGELGL